jgi:hypothetical protein
MIPAARFKCLVEGAIPPAIIRKGKPLFLKDSAISEVCPRMPSYQLPAEGGYE